MRVHLPILVAFAVTTQFASAAIQTIEPDNYAHGTIINSVGITLEVRDYQLNSTNPVISVELGANFSSTGVRNFGGGFHGGRQFIALFDNPISYFAIDVVNDDQGLGSDSAILAAYGANGDILGFSDWITVPATPWPGFKTIDISGSGISRIEVISDEWIQLDNLRFSDTPINAVPEPSLLWLFASALSVLGLQTRTKKLP